MLFTLVKYGSIGVVHLLVPPGLEEKCQPDRMFSSLLGGPGLSLASRPVQPGRGLVLVWGGFYEQGGAIYVQSFARFTRRGTEERLVVQLGGGPGTELISKLPAQTVAFPPRRVSYDDLRRVDEEFRRLSGTRDRPDPAAVPRAMPTGQDVPFAYAVDQVREDGWLHIHPYADGGPAGWVQARMAP